MAAASHMNAVAVESLGGDLLGLENVGE